MVTITATSAPNTHGAATTSRSNANQTEIAAHSVVRIARPMATEQAQRRVVPDRRLGAFGQVGIGGFDLGQHPQGVFVSGHGVFLTFHCGKS